MPRVRFDTSLTTAKASGKISLKILLFMFLSSDSNVLKKLGYIYILLILGWNIFFSYNFDRGEFSYISEVSKTVSMAWRNEIIDKEKKVFFERSSLTPFFYDHLAFSVLTNHPKNIFI